MNQLIKTGGLIITSTACLKEKRTCIGVLSGGLIFVLRSLKILPYLKFYKIRELEKIITSCGFKIIESNILIDKPATEYYIVAQKL
jgi:2-polyprenyl-3-methyl-5-hydroxy-6-metoxy-1,4-benzoquinol methylase